MGAGSIGQLAAAGAQAQGAGEVALQARYPFQHEVRERLGVGEPTGLYDIVIEATGSSTAMQRCIDLAKPGGTIVILGVIYGTLDVPFRPIFTRELRLVSSMGYCGHAGHHEMSLAAEMLASRPDRGLAHHASIPAPGSGRSLPGRRRPKVRSPQGRCRDRIHLMKQIEGTVAVVTGAASGIGLGIASQLVERVHTSCWRAWTSSAWHVRSSAWARNGCTACCAT